VTVATVLRSGGDYDARWVHTLYRQLDRHMPEPWTFACLSDDPSVPGYVPLRHDWPRWWPKIELFRPGLFDGPVLYLDLDTLVLGDLSGIASYCGRMAMLADFYRLLRGRRQGESGVMAWTPGEHTEAVYRAYVKRPVRTGGDGPFIRRHVEHEYLQDLYPGQIASFKADARRGPPDGARLVAGHGRPRFSDPRAGWAHDFWKAA
jgi:hypothetical protein